ncbi:alpha/beta fold hydrolase [Allorhizobium sonneratiae]|uniref:alpha/beta fold hydrolase n=1 Tax=Allorhizobium sonneratiae TaxID=2934936 RepID=UPI00237C82E7|nr:alpha/beta hydrolase [Allorhizobium sonneratiae]
MLLICGLGMQMIRWTEPFCQELAASGHRVIRFDNRDSGWSTHFTDSAVPDFAELASAMMAGHRLHVPYTLFDMAADAIGLLDQLGIEQAHVVGRSMGGMSAQIMASHHASRLLSLTSIMSSTGNPSLPQADADVMGLMLRPAPDPTDDLEGFLDLRLAFARRIAGRNFPFNEALHRAIVRGEVRRSHDPAGTARQLAAMAVAGERRAALATVTAPSCIIHGTDDPLIPAACGLDTALSIPDALYIPIEGMGHDVPAELYKTVIDSICAVAMKA